MPEKDMIQQWVPMTMFGTTRLVPVNVDRATAQDYAKAEEEEARKFGIQKRRLYVGGRQYDAENAKAAQDSGCGPLERTPEHRRIHAYSTQIGECVGFLANRLGEGFVIQAKDTKVQQIIDEMVEATDVISAYDDEGNLQVVTDDVLWEALVAGDTPTYIGWDPIEERLFLEFWEAERIQFEMATATIPKKVTRSEIIWAVDEQGIERQMLERMVYDLAYNEAGVQEARVTRFLGENTTAPTDPPMWLGIGTLPWRLLAADRKSLRAYRGDSIITEQAMETADRYNAVEQTGYLIARYNSHSNVAVIGDAASLKMESDGRVSKDVADVLTFPGGTALQVLSLPTDPQMITHQRTVLSEALHSAFGLTRVEPDTLSGLGQVSGYALEILNQKTEGTFSRVRRNWRKGWYGIIDAGLDIYAWKTESTFGLYNPVTGEMRDWSVSTDPTTVIEIPEGFILMNRWWDVDVDSVFSKRQVSIRMGSGYIVDDVKIRDDFVAELISREEALRQRGMDDKKIKIILGEIDKQAEKSKVDATQEIGVFSSGTAAGGTVAGTTEAPAARQEPSA